MTPSPDAAALEALFAPASELARALGPWVQARRWYRTKTRRVRAAQIGASFALDAPLPARVAIVDLALEGEGAAGSPSSASYVVPLALVDGARARQIASERPGAIVLEAGSSCVVDALVVPEVLSALLSGIARGETLTSADATLSSRHLAAIDLAGATPARALDAEQTNTSVLFGQCYVGKIVRKVDAGASADLEMGRFLTEVGYAHAPPLAGFVELTRGAESPATLGLLHAFVPNQGDAFTHTLAILERTFAEAERGGASPSPELALQLSGYGARAATLGRRVGQLHAALASRPDDPAFGPEPLDAAERRALASRVRAELAAALEALEARPELAGDSRVAEIRAREAALAAGLDAVAALGDAGARTRVHGDLHLGQILVAGDDFVLIDFEGEPGRPLEERRQKRAPLVDVAGVLRSYDYAAVLAVRALPEPRRARLAPWARAFSRAVSSVFLDAYVEEASPAGVLPPAAGLTSLLGALLLEKCLYEVRYELDNRPDFVEVPLAGLHALATAGER